jgi:hypothetical protein
MPCLNCWVGNEHRDLSKVRYSSDGAVTGGHLLRWVIEHLRVVGEEASEEAVDGLVALSETARRLVCADVVHLLAERTTTTPLSLTPGERGILFLMVDGMTAENAPDPLRPGH